MMTAIVSFPNFLCLLLTGLLVIHIVTRSPLEGSFPESSEDLEVIYCKLPQSRKTDDSRKCSSAQKLFTLLKNGCSIERRIIQLISKSNETELEDNVQTVVQVKVERELELDVNEPEEQPEEEMKSSLVDSFVISLLVCSAIASLIEWHRERSKREEQVGGEGASATGGGGGEPASDRRISLVDLTVNRHIRRRDFQQAEVLRQNSAQGSRPPLLRRSSFPAQMPEVRSRHAPQRQQSIPLTRRMSIDLEDDGSPDRRRVRIIRRH